MSLYSNAKELYNNKEYEKAFDMVQRAIAENKSINLFHFHLLCQISRKLKKHKYFLDTIYALINQEKILETDFTNDIAWCIYDLYVKDYNESCNYDLMEKSNFIIEKCDQQENNYVSPLVITIFKIVDYLKKEKSVKYKLIIQLLEKLDYTKLSTTDVFQFTDENSKERELPSKRERYYQDLSKAYEKTGEYYECYNLCSTALDDNIEWHYRNDLWLLARKHYCECFINDNFEESINNYKEVAEKNRFWYMYHKLANIYFAHNLIDDATVFACLAFDVSQDIEKKVNLMYDLGLLFEASNQNDSAQKFFQCCGYYRNLHGWNIGVDLKYKREYYELNFSNVPNIKELKKITIEELKRKTNKNIGIIAKINEERGFGFIKYKNNRDIYFKKIQIKNKKHFLKAGSYVEFDIRIQDDGRESAVNIREI